MFFYQLNISCLFILFRLLCLGCPFCRLEVHGSSYCGACSLWVGLGEWLVKVSWLAELASVFWWVELDLFSLKCNGVSISEFWGIYGFAVTSGSLYFNAEGYVPAMLES